jgi:uncharacterized protein YndB with AHSA1/START domain
MKKTANTLEVKVVRTIPAPPGELFSAWLNPKIPGTPWHEADKLILDPRVDGFFYWLIRGTPHYGRFTRMEGPGLLQHTWMSPNTLGQESMVTVTFKKQGTDTLMTLVHSGLPDSDEGRSHEKGWNYFMGMFSERFGDAARKSK